jgi:XTP/dITP diphosphohydrolase
MPIVLYVASSNPGKLRDFAEAAKGHSNGVTLHPLPGLETIPPPEENGGTFEENAITKAIAYSLHDVDFTVLADDSGLEVDALDGAPGVHSARYAALAGFDPDPHGQLTPDERNNRLLLVNLQGVPPGRRVARYRCVLAAARNGRCVALGPGTVEGTILETPRGHGGFGYDPLFQIEGSRLTMAEIGLGEKLKISHRGRALRNLLENFQSEEMKRER